ncbi:MAG: MBL fold metallo-hydrolase [Pseudomonadales bacterium]|nr:MBL fold metallo-hydrolase [Pseudomonadales bacterium]
MIFRQLFDEDSYTYTYLLADALSREAIIIDPVNSRVESYLQLLKELGLTLVYVTDTHVHADHITGSGLLRDATGCKSLMSEQSGTRCASAYFNDNDVIQVGALRLQCLYTPGHTSDSYCFYEEKHGMLFTGDTLLIRGSGRTDFQSGSASSQYRSLQRLLSLPAKTVVYAGHDYKGWTMSTLAEEKQHNPRLQVADEAEYIELMNSLKLADPKMMDVAVPANQQCGKTQ